MTKRFSNIHRKSLPSDPFVMWFNSSIQLKELFLTRIYNWHVLNMNREILKKET